MIFSVILIIFFIAIAFIVIKSFLGSRDCAQLGTFIQRFENQIDSVWNSDFSQHSFPGVVPSGIKYICFMELSKDSFGDFEDIGSELSVYRGGKNQKNTFFYPPGKACEMPARVVSHLDIPTITKTDNPYCVPVRKGKVNLEIEKKSGSGLVIVR